MTPVPLNPLTAVRSQVPQCSSLLAQETQYLPCHLFPWATKYISREVLPEESDVEMSAFNCAFCGAKLSELTVEKVTDPMRHGEAERFPFLGG